MSAYQLEIQRLAPWCALNSIFGFNPQVGRDLIRRFGGADKVFSVGSRELMRLPGLSHTYAAKITDSAIDAAQEELEGLLNESKRFICLDDPSYPSMLADCPDPPLGLYIHSDTSPDQLFSKKPCIAIVGTRDITSYGKQWCSRIVSAIAKAVVKPVIVSGLAIGTDITAHTAALERGLDTWAVLPTGIDDIYPARHWKEAESISTREGCALITDYPPSTTPKAINFLRRNRIIAGLCSATILIESKAKGGGMITCRLASSYNREVYALPGRVDDMASEGCNRLIKEKAAEIVCSPEELTDALGLGAVSGREEKTLTESVYSKYCVPGSGLDPDIAERIIRIIADNRDIRTEELCSLTDLDYKDVARYVNRMECDGFISTDLFSRCSIRADF